MAINEVILEPFAYDRVGEAQVRTRGVPVIVPEPIAIKEQVGDVEYKAVGVAQNRYHVNPIEEYKQNLAMYDNMFDSSASSSDSAQPSGTSNQTTVSIVICGAIIVVAALMLLLFHCIRKRQYKKTSVKSDEETTKFDGDEEDPTPNMAEYLPQNLWAEKAEKAEDRTLMFSAEDEDDTNTLHRSSTINSSHCESISDDQPSNYPMLERLSSVKRN